VEGEHIRYRTLAQGGAGNRKQHHRELWRLEPELKGAGSAKAQMNTLEGLKYHYVLEEFKELLASRSIRIEVGSSNEESLERLSKAGLLGIDD
jgi:aspartyl/asparaginyl-tRNA synthetase